MSANSPSIIQYAIPAIIIALVLFLRLRSVGRPRALKIGKLWIVPLVYSLIALAMFVSFPPQGLVWLYAALALMAGLALGWQRGRLMHIAVDPESGAVTQKTSAAAVVFIVVLIGVRFASGALIGGATTVGSDGALHGPALAATDVLIAMALGFLTAQRLEIYLRAKRLLAEAAQRRAAG